ncbi:MAG: type IV secretory system conjugative DNA transfer family protein [Collinsella sp.]
MSNLASRLAASESASSTILAKDRTLSCDTRQTGLNNNALVIGPSGAGKTRNVLKPNLLQMNASYIVLDTKGTLCREVGPVLAAHGYRVQCLNFADLNTVPALAPGIERCGYNPLRHIRRKADGRPNQQDILSVAKAICPIEDNNQPFGIMRRQPAVVSCRLRHRTATRRRADDQLGHQADRAPAGRCHGPIV